MILLDQIARSAVARSATADFVPYRELTTPELMDDFCRDYGLIEPRVRLGYFDESIRLWSIDRDMANWSKKWAK